MKEFLSETYTTWGYAKLLQHLDVLQTMQKEKCITPIQIQICPTERCESDCPFCAVGCRPHKSFMPFPALEKCLYDFKKLGAKAVEITGGGNPLLYQDPTYNKNINDIITISAKMGYDIGIITNSHKLSTINRSLFDKINWIRVSLIKIDEGVNPEDYDFNEFPIKKLGFSYIVYEPGEGYRTNKNYKGTTASSFEKINELIKRYPDIKFVRIAGDSRIPGYNKITKNNYTDLLASINNKFFIKDIDVNDKPFNNKCFVGMIRPYIAPSPSGNEYYVYVCNSYLLNTKQNYDLNFALCEIGEIEKTWKKLNDNFKNKGYPYEVNHNMGTNWQSTCKICCYSPNNELLHLASLNMADKNFC